MNTWNFVVLDFSGSQNDAFPLLKIVNAMLRFGLQERIQLARPDAFARCSQGTSDDADSLYF